MPDIRERLDHVEAATPRTFQHYTQHLQGASFGTKFEGLAVSRGLPEQIAGLYHAGSVGIIMSGWLGAINYGVIVANDVDAMLLKAHAGSPACRQTTHPLKRAQIEARFPIAADAADRRNRGAGPNSGSSAARRFVTMSSSSRATTRTIRWCPA